MTASLVLHPVRSTLFAKPPATSLSAGARAALGDPALPAMTDFRRSPMVTVTADVQVDRALEYMIVAGVRFCFVVDALSRVLGAVTSYDIQGEKPARHVQSMGGDLRAVSRAEVQVRHIMEPVAGWQVIDLDQAARATLAQIVAALKTLGRRHLVVVEQMGGAQMLRGLFSASRIEQDTGLNLDIFPVPTTFAEIERAVEHP